MADVLLCSTYEDRQQDFVFEFRDRGQLKKLLVPLPVPLKLSAREFAFRLIKAHDLPCHLETDLITSLEKFCQKTSDDLHNELAKLALEEFQNSPQIAEDCISTWSNAFTHEHSKYCAASDVSEETAFSKRYHYLILSPALETLLQLENTYALAMQDLVMKNESAIKSMEEKHELQMDNTINNVGVMASDRDVTNLAARHIEDSQMLQSFWSSELSQLQELQRREYREWVTKVHEDAITVSSDPSSALGAFGFGKRRDNTSSSATNEEFQTSEPEVRLEESFTIHLGAQKKTTHNLRLICGDVLDLCRHKTPPGGSILSQPHRIQTALSLYSEALAGLILLVDDSLNTFTGIMKEFASICQQSTDFHFPDLDKQLCLIQQNVERKKRRRSTASLHQPAGTPGLHSLVMETGDFYVTRHSNLAEVHVVFHVVTDDSVKASSINTRNPVIMGLRNALHTAVRHSITTITIPLLLCHEMTEEMTISWCTRRAELVFKCVKGFMMECISWSGAGSLNVQFMVPKAIEEDMFHTFRSMLPNIFRVSTPLNLTSTGNHTKPSQDS